MIFGRWSPIGALFAALLFGFANNLQSILGIIGTPIPSQFMLMAPYLATIFAVAGLVGRVRAPAAAGGQAYVVFPAIGAATDAPAEPSLLGLGARLRETLGEARSAVLEYRLLLKVLQLTSKFNYPTVEAQVIGESPGNFQNTIEINVGSNQGNIIVV